jgi:hypothetical protein
MASSPAHETKGARIVGALKKPDTVRARVMNGRVEEYEDVVVRSSAYVRVHLIQHPPLLAFIFASTRFVP